MAFNYNVTIPTHIFLSHLDRLEKQLTTQIRNDFDFNRHLGLVGKLQLIEELKNLPETLKVIEESDHATT